MIFVTAALILSIGLASLSDALHFDTMSSTRSPNTTSGTASGTALEVAPNTSSNAPDDAPDTVPGDGMEQYAQAQSEEQGPHLNLQLMNTVMRAAELDYMVSNVDCDRDDNFDDGTESMCVDNNVAIFKEEDGICFVGFRGSQGFRDFVDDINPGWSDVCNDQGECCLCRAGFVHSFNTELLKSWIEERISDCMSRCTDDNPECLVITGHSLGGAIATVASIAYHHLNPLIITFGETPALLDHCPIIDGKRHFRFVSSEYRGSGVAYDPIPFYTIGNGEHHVGEYILISDQDKDRALYLGMNADTAFSPTWLSQWTVHQLSHYLPAIRNLREVAASSGQVPLDGFRLGTYCTKNIECSNGRCGHNGLRRVCLPFVEDGGSCNESSDCWSGRCDASSYLSLSFICFSKLTDGEPCNEGLDCLSGRCDARSFVNPEHVCFSKVTDGELCNEDEDCNSGRCDASSHLSLTQICWAKLGNGEYCNDSSDCLSEDCDYRFWTSVFLTCIGNTDVGSNAVANLKASS